MKLSKVEVKMPFLVYNEKGDKVEKKRTTTSYILFPPGLVATRPVRTLPGRELLESKRGWNITHQATGLVLSHIRLKTLGEAQSLACDIADLGFDWTQQEVSEIRESFSNNAASAEYQDADWDGRTFREAVSAIFEDPPGGAHTIGVVRC